MKTIEAPLTAILIVLCLGFLGNAHYERIQLAEQERIELERKLEQLAKLEKIAQEREARTIEVEIIHDFDPNTNTYPVVVTANESNDPDGDEFTYSWSQSEGEKVQVIGVRTPQISFNAKAGEYAFVLTVQDNYGAACAEYVIVNVGAEPNSCPNPVINYSSGG